MTARIKIRRDSAASWASNNPILAAGELGLDTDANQIKVGNGTALWSALPFVTSSGGSGGGASNLVFDTENIGFYTLALPNVPTQAKYNATTADSSASNTIADTIFVVGEYYEDSTNRWYGFVTKRNPDNSEAWTRAYQNNTGDQLRLNAIIWDAATDKLYTSGSTYDGSFWKAVLFELDTTNGDILNQTKYTAPDGNYPNITDLLVDPADGSPVLVGQVWDTPLKVHITPVSDSGVPQGQSSTGQDLDPDMSLLVFAKTDFTSTGYYPDSNDGNDWNLFDQQQPNNNNSVSSLGRLNQIRWLEPQTDTGNGSGVRVHLTYSITKNKWISAEHAGWTNGAGYGYQVGDKVRVLGSQLGGSDGTDDVVLTVRYVYDVPWSHQIEFVNLEQQQGVPTPTAAITNYVRAWIWSYWDFASSVNDGTVWDFGHFEYNSGFVLTNNFQKVFGTGSYSDKVKSADIYNDGGTSYLYVGCYIDSYQDEYRGKRAAIHKLNLSDGAEQWSYTIDRISDGTQNGDEIQSVNCDSQGNIYVVANGPDENDVWGLVVTKIDSTGSIIWQTYQDPGQGYWDNAAKGDVDLNDNTLYIGGDYGAGYRLISINSNTGLVTWARDIDFVNRYQLNTENNYQSVAVGRGRLSILGSAWDWDNLYNNGQQFGVMFALDANLISFSEVESGTFGIFKFVVSNYHLVSNGAGNHYEIPVAELFKDSTVITSTGDDAMSTATSNLTQTAVAITRSPYGIQNVQSITFADGTVQSSAGSAIKHKWKNPNGNEWKIVEWNGGKAVNFNQYGGYSSFYLFTAKTSGDQIDSIQLNQTNVSAEWQAWNNLSKDNARFYNSYTGQEYRIQGWNTNQDGYVTLNLQILPGQTLPTYSQGDQLEFRYDTAESINPVMWFDPSDSPWGMGNFRGAVIKYHAYSDNGSGTFIGEIKYAYDYTSNTEEATHSEQWSGNSDLSMMSFWHQEDGRLYYKNTVYETDYVLIQWTATMFYGNEANC